MTEGRKPGRASRWQKKGSRHATQYIRPRKPSKVKVSALVRPDIFVPSRPTAKDVAKLRPIGTVAFLDAVRVFLKTPLSPVDLEWLKPRAGGEAFKVQNARPYFDRRYKQRLCLFQPTYQALRRLSLISGVLITYVEFALDHAFETEEDKNLWFHCCSMLFVKNYHRDQKVLFVGDYGKETRYSGPRRSASVVASYRDRPSKILRRPTMHIEWRVRRSRVLARLGISDFSDLLRVSHYDFWKKRLKLAMPDPHAIGRMVHNHRLTHKRKAKWVQWYGRLAYDVYSRIGGTLIRGTLNGSSQDLIDAYRALFPIQRGLVPIDVAHLLPPRE